MGVAGFCGYFPRIRRTSIVPEKCWRQEAVEGEGADCPSAGSYLERPGVLVCNRIGRRLLRRVQLPTRKFSRFTRQFNCSLAQLGQI